jgi:hypothetical protein
MRDPVNGVGWSAEPLSILDDDGVTSMVRLTIATDDGQLYLMALDPMVALGVGIDLIRASNAEPERWLSEDDDDD